MQIGCVVVTMTGSAHRPPCKIGQRCERQVRPLSRRVCATGTTPCNVQKCGSVAIILVAAGKPVRRRISAMIPRPEKPCSAPQGSSADASTPHIPLHETLDI